ncbi:MAG: hypothetical protein GY716_00075 [bacterium]|nr:hypothetical protein [bacterium]
MKNYERPRIDNLSASDIVESVGPVQALGSGVAISPVGGDTMPSSVAQPGQPTSLKR